MRAVVALLAVAACCAVSPVADVHADPSPATFSIGPASFSDVNVQGRDFAFQMVPGQVAHDSVAIRNTSDSGLTIDLYGADVSQASGGGLSPAQESAPMTDVGSWITLGERRIALAPGERKVVDFTIALPAAVTPGDHLGAIVAEAVVERRGQQTLDARAALLTDVTVPGRAQLAVQLSNLTSQTVGDRLLTFTTRITNRGNLVVTFTATVVIRSGPGGAATTIPLRPSAVTLLPGSSLDLSTTGYSFGYGSYTVEADVDATGMDRTYRQVVKTTPVVLDFVNWPPIIAAIGAGIAAVVSVAVAYLLRRRGRPSRSRGTQRLSR